MTIEDTLDQYCTAWSTADAAQRTALLEAVWAEEGVYRDPKADVTGRAALGAYIGEVHQGMPGVRIERTTDVSAHHGHVFFGWRLITADGGVVVEGLDFGTLAPDGRITQIVGFFGPPGT